MVGRLQVVLLSILPTGAALVYLFWMYGWKKTKGTRGRHCQKTQLVEVSRADCDCEWSHDKVDNTAVSCGEEVLLSVHSEQDISAENDVSSGMSVSADVSASPTSNCTDLESTCGDELISATVVRKAVNWLWMLVAVAPAWMITLLLRQTTVTLWMSVSVQKQMTLLMKMRN